MADVATFNRPLDPVQIVKADACDPVQIVKADACDPRTFLRGTPTPTPTTESITSFELTMTYDDCECLPITVTITTENGSGSSASKVWPDGISLPHTETWVAADWTVGPAPGIHSTNLVTITGNSSDLDFDAGSNVSGTIVGILWNGIGTKTITFNAAVSTLEFHQES